MTLHRTPISRPWRLLAVLSGALAACTAVAEAAPAQDPPPTPGFHCIVMPHAVIDISSGTGGRLDSVHVERGDPVSRHQLVAELESGVERAQVALAGTRAAIDTEVRLREAGEQVDARNADRIAALHATRMVSAQQREEADRDASVATLRVREAREKRRLAKLELARAEEVLKLRAVRSPISGVVVDRFKWPGEFVDNEAILRVAQLDPLRVEVILPVAEHRSLRIGQRVEVVPETEPDSPRIATIKVVDPMADPTSGMFRATLDLPNPGNRLLAGIKCEARLRDGPAAVVNLAGPSAMPKPGGAQPDMARESPSIPTPAIGLESDPPAVEPDAPRVPGSEAPRAPLRSAGLPAPSAPAALRRATLAAPEPRHAPTQSCRGLGPMANAAAAAQIARTLSNAGLETSVRESVTHEANGFIVLTAQAGDPRRTVKQLRAKGVHDLLLLGSGEFAGRVSLGIYKGPRQAERRRQAIERKGISAQVMQRTRARAAWWVDVRASEALREPNALGALLATYAPDLSERVSTCPSPVSAAL